MQLYNQNTYIFFTPCVFAVMDVCRPRLVRRRLGDLRRWRRGALENLMRCLHGCRSIKPHVRSCWEMNYSTFPFGDFCLCSLFFCGMLHRTWQPQFYIQLLYKVTISFTLKFKTLSSSLVLPQKVCQGGQIIRKWLAEHG